jgi:hypothetical protein
MTNPNLQTSESPPAPVDVCFDPPPLITREIAQNVLRMVDAGLSEGVGRREPGQMCVEAVVCCALGLPHGDDPGCVAEWLRCLMIQLNDSVWSSRQARAQGLRRAAVAQLGSKGVLNESEFAVRVMRVALGRVPAAFRAAASLLGSERHRLELNAVADACEPNPTRLSFIAARKAAQSAHDDDLSGNAASAVYAAIAAANAAVEATAPSRIDNDTLECAVNAAIWAAEAAVAVETASNSAPPDAGAAARDQALAQLVEDVVQVLIQMQAPGCQWLDLTEPAEAGAGDAPAA